MGEPLLITITINIGDQNIISASQGIDISDLSTEERRTATWVLLDGLARLAHRAIPGAASD